MSRRSNLRGMGRGEGIMQREWWAASTEELRRRPCGRAEYMGGREGARAGHCEQSKELGFHVVENVNDPNGQAAMAHGST